jgi:hypothetical protein
MDINLRSRIHDSDNFYQNSYRRWNVRSFRLTLTYKLGSLNFSLFERNYGDERSENDDDDTNQGGQQ